ncbi:putative NADP-dependent isopropanol dehydrogenase [Grifola frondosa]|uniref:Putative NADP-dependent isopropanol dehydrogenase n=1 Tax=Grifola frondosa TaxID=5627 RepID=A0A1C7MKK0_GRIFR|nr:putative NADP-dependent isopropanol dehydrogenase [Grifola frondosa]
MEVPGCRRLLLACFMTKTPRTILNEQYSTTLHPIDALVVHNDSDQRIRVFTSSRVTDDVPTTALGHILKHESLGVVKSVGTGIDVFKPGDRMIISCITACAGSHYYQRAMPSHCTDGGWILENVIDSTQVKFVCVPHADSTLYTVPAGVDESALVVINNILIRR